MRLNDLLPDTFTYNDEEISIDLAFDNILDVFDILKMKELPEFNRAELSLVLLFGEDVIDFEDTIEVYNQVFDLFLNTKDDHKPVRYDIAGNPMPEKEDDKGDVPLIDLSQDAEFLYASFIQAYGINLIKEQGKLHWYEFKALLNGLPEDTIIKQIIHIRSYKSGEHDSKEYKKQMEDLQDFYRLEVDDEWREMEE